MFPGRRTFTAGERLRPGDPAHVGADGLVRRTVPPIVPSGWTSWCHPDNLDAVKAALGTVSIPGHPEVLLGNGDRIRTSALMPRTSRRWEFPETPFVAYDRSDECWAIPLGFGRWVDDDAPVVYRARDDIGRSTTLRSGWDEAYDRAYRRSFLTGPFSI